MQCSGVFVQCRSTEERLLKTSDLKWQRGCALSLRYSECAVVCTTTNKHCISLGPNFGRGEEAAHTPKKGSWASETIWRRGLLLLDPSAQKIGSGGIAWMNVLYIQSAPLLPTHHVRVRHAGGRRADLAHGHVIASAQRSAAIAPARSPAPQERWAEAVRAARASSQASATMAQITISR